MWRELCITGAADAVEAAYYFYPSAWWSSYRGKTEESGTSTTSINRFLCATSVSLGKVFAANCLTTETRRTQRLHREEDLVTFV